MILTIGLFLALLFLWVAAGSVVLAAPLWLAVKLVCGFTARFYVCFRLLLITRLTEAALGSAFAVTILINGGDLSTLETYPLLVPLIVLNAWIHVALFATMLKAPDSVSISFLKAFLTFLVYSALVWGTASFIAYAFALPWFSSTGR